MNKQETSKTAACFALVFLGALALASPPARAESGTIQAASPGKPVPSEPGWPEGVLDVVNDSLRTEGWRPYFSEWPNDVNHYAFQVGDMDEVNHLIKKLAAIKAERLMVQLSPAKEARGLGFTTVLPEGNGAGVVFSIGNQKRMDEWYQRLPEIEPGVRKFGVQRYREVPVARPPTLTLYVGHEAIDLNKLKISDLVEVVSDPMPAGKAPEARVKAIEKFMTDLKSNRQSRAGLPAPAPEPKEGAKPQAKKIPGRVTDEAGKPLAKVRWRISAFEEWQDDHWELNHDIVTGEQPEFFTDGEGRFELKFARHVRFDLQFDKADFAPAFLYQVAPDAGDLHVVMKHGVPVRGSVVRADTKQPIRGRRVVILRLPTRGWWFQTWTYLSWEGEFEFRAAPPPNEPGRAKPAQWQIEYAGQSIPIDVREGEPVNVRVKVDVSTDKPDFSSKQSAAKTSKPTEPQTEVVSQSP